MPYELALLPPSTLGEPVVVLPEPTWEDESSEEELLLELEAFLLDHREDLKEADTEDVIELLADLTEEGICSLEEDLVKFLLFSLDGVRGAVNRPIDPYRFPISDIDDCGLNRPKLEGGCGDIDMTEAGLTG